MAESLANTTVSTTKVHRGGTRIVYTGYRVSLSANYPPMAVPLKKEESTSVEIFDRSMNKASRPPKYYNLDVIISVGYRVKSKRGVEFRKWANSVLLH